MLAKPPTLSVVALTGDQTPTLDDARAVAVARFMARKDACSVVNPDAIATKELLLRLADSALLVLRPQAEGAYAVGYVASVFAAKEVRAAKSSVWPSVLANRLARDVRSTKGAMFYFADETGPGRLEVFITDWSPCPAACAVAVHHQHPYAAGFADRREDVFTGRFVRHPLTGDLLPVWVASWVKPGFGTGAVLVNPAHDAVDLAFGRRIGLPIRFALVDKSASGGEGRPQPPIIKTGITIRTGEWDGLGCLEASAAYFNILVQRGLAVTHEDARLPMADIAVLTPSSQGQVSVDPRSSRIIPATSSHPQYDVGASAALAAATTIVSQESCALVASSRAQRSVFPVLVPLLIDIAPAHNSLTKVIALQPVESTKLGDHPHFDFAVLVAARLDQPAVVRPQLIEQVERFVSHHSAIARTWMSGTAHMDDRESFQRLQPKIAGAFEALDLASAFKLTYALQKEIAAGAVDDPAVVAAYLMSAHLLGL